MNGNVDHHSWFQFDFKLKTKNNNNEQKLYVFIQYNVVKLIVKEKIENNQIDDHNIKWHAQFQLEMSRWKPKNQCCIPMCNMK